MKNKKSLLITHPQIARQWHPTKNGDLTPDKVVAGSGKKAWWKCPKGPDHEWSAVLDSRTGKMKTDCPCCTGQQVSVTNSLATQFPDIATEWHPTKNGDLTPDKIVTGSEKKSGGNAPRVRITNGRPGWLIVQKLTEKLAVHIVILSQDQSKKYT